ncbi:hypothetical protein ABVT39_022877 [Epinephelus coioides]
MRLSVTLLLLLLLLRTKELLMESHGGEILRYSQDDLLLLRHMDYSVPDLDNCGSLLLRQRGPGCVPTRKQGRRGGVRQRLKRLTEFSLDGFGSPLRLDQDNVSSLK